MKKEVTLNELVNSFIGRKGRLVSMSKSCGPAMAVYNSNMVVNDEVIWYGDIDLEEDKNILLALSELFGTDIKIYREHGVRVFPFEVKDEVELKEEQKKRIKQNNPVWTTAAPEKYDNKDYLTILAQMNEMRDKNRKDRAICFGLLTPGGTNWAWHNTWWYKGPHKLYRIFKRNYKVFVQYPLQSVKYKKEKQKLSIWKQILLFLQFVKREVNYHREEVKENGVSWTELLFDY